MAESPAEEPASASREEPEGPRADSENNNNSTLPNGDNAVSSGSGADNAAASGGGADIMENNEENDDGNNQMEAKKDEDKDGNGIPDNLDADLIALEELKKVNSQTIITIRHHVVVHLKSITYRTI